MTDKPEPLVASFARGTEDPDRSYRLRQDEPVPDGIRRIARGQLDGGREQLAAADDDLAEAVHATRKRLKRLRALVRLSRDAIDEPTYEREKLVFRTAGRRLSAGRDAQVLLDTLDDLGERRPGDLPPHITADLRAQLVADRDDALASLRDDGTDEVLAALDKARERTARWRFERDGFDGLTPGLRSIYSRGRKRFRAARNDPTPENLHEWRKRVKELWHATQVVCDAHPERLDRFAKRAHKLADALGDGHDLEVLRAYVERHPQTVPHEPSRKALLAAIEQRSGELRDKALARGRKLYKRKPRKFAQRIENAWRERAAR
jgi:CHAD domain-containing protein